MSYNYDSLQCLLVFAASVCSLFDDPFALLRESSVFATGSVIQDVQRHVKYSTLWQTVMTGCRTLHIKSLISCTCWYTCDWLLKGLLSFGACAWSFLALSAFSLFGVSACSFADLSLLFFCEWTVFMVASEIQDNRKDVQCPTLWHASMTGSSTCTILKQMWLCIMCDLKLWMSHYSAYCFFPTLPARFSTMAL